MDNIFQLFSAQGQSEKLQALYESKPEVYLRLALGFTLIGYFLIALIPLYFLSAVITLISGISDAKTWSDWQSLLVWLGIAAGSGFLTVLMLRLHVSSPSGLGIKPDKAPKLYELLDELQQSFKHPRIDRVVLHDNFSLEFIPVPRFGLPLLTVNVLYIGLPVMQSLSATQFKGMLARKLGQYSMQHNRLTHMIYRFRQYAALYQLAYTKQSREQWFYLPFKWFFQLYVPWLNALTVHAARRDELEADAYALQVMNNDEYADNLIRTAVVETFLQEKYWPKVNELISKQPPPADIMPHSSMSKALRSGLSDTEFAASLERLMKQDPPWNSAVPGLHTRLEHMGHRTLSLPPPVLESAAQRLLGTAFGAIVKLMDQHWLSKQGIKPKKNTRAPHHTPDTAGNEQHTYESLVRKSSQQQLNDDELWQLGELTEKIEGKAAAIGVFQKLLKRNSAHAKTWMSIGRILLSQQDATGVKALERAMELDPASTAQTCWVLAKYFKAQGNEELAKRYGAKAGQAKSSHAA